MQIRFLAMVGRDIVSGKLKIDVFGKPRKTGFCFLHILITNTKQYNKTVKHHSSPSQRAKRRSGRNPGARVTNSARLFKREEKAS